ncbi:hypothetical protein RHMOL_Rhmol01G0083600 [Rhododendron molle]|uniref:Uncharacterized protein n=1 Tax=Rhododendron molle TaxID=49168 RepID=A0ACC0Q2L5_RHOML|nr:hypothetical protein RHMOL_Rhmol01G0083600 [Rhododendron molle]
METRKGVQLLRHQNHPARAGRAGWDNGRVQVADVSARQPPPEVQGGRGGNCYGESCSRRKGREYSPSLMNHRISMNGRTESIALKNPSLFVVLIRSHYNFLQRRRYVKNSNDVHKLLFDDDDYGSTLIPNTRAMFVAGLVAKQQPSCQGPAAVIDHFKSKRSAATGCVDSSSSPFASTQ